MVIVPTQNIPNQRFKVVLDGQFCTISLRQRGNRMYLDLVTADNEVCYGAICVDRASIVQSPSPYFVGSLHFFDSEGGGNVAEYTGLNSRYFLIYVSEDEDFPETLLY